ncbi:MAG: hypothetical protein EAZ39_13900 [Oscillatoriales cyanobacterium]|nr:MAG: hypothetical protein EAZ39_13900 [Oscillatoriales cyanobacterium]TAG45469.1 MAG: hypothetical protein EAZ33_07280 [Oscillatoriales cyanobacterium]TAG60609.1 MAG: hypothetical protein EAZ28_06555 [Oscillatoriales cyanobacterium]
MIEEIACFPLLHPPTKETGFFSRFNTVIQYFRKNPGFWALLFESYILTFITKTPILRKNTLQNPNTQ